MIESVSPSMRPAENIRVSVIIPVYNSDSTLARALESVITQDFGGWEVVAVDDGSTDSSFTVLQDYRDRLGSRRMKVSRQRNRGPAAARNAGARMSSGEYFAFLDADDEWSSGKLRACVEALDACPGAVLAYSDMTGVDGQSLRPMAGSPSLEYLLNAPFALFPSATVVRRDAFERCGGFAEEFVRPFGEDTFLGLRLRELGEFMHIPQPLVVYHGSEVFTALAKYEGGYRTFTHLAKERYGRRSRGICMHVRQYYCSLLLGAAMTDLRKVDLPGAFSNLARAVRVSPSFTIRSVLGKARRRYSADRREIKARG